MATWMRVRFAFMVVTLFRSHGTMGRAIGREP